MTMTIMAKGINDLLFASLSTAEGNRGKSYRRGWVHDVRTENTWPKHPMTSRDTVYIHHNHKNNHKFKLGY